MATLTEQDTPYTQVGRKHKAKAGTLTQTNPDIEVSNSFDALSVVEEVEEEEVESLPPP